MRPIAQPGNDSVDVTYRFGNTQGGRREPHHGVEFLNPYGTPVLAAADGVVVVAGEDSDPVSPPGAWPLVYLGMFSDFYGNVVVIQHPTPAALLGPFPDLPQTLYTLYAHLSEISVQVGQQVQVGQEIGNVGMSGVAQGPHLHFEVRLGEDLYRASRNPELWLRPHAGADGQLNGAMAGSFIDSAGNNLMKTSIVLEHLPNGPDQPNDLVIPLLSYEEKGLIGEPPWGESFGVGDIPPGLYRISFPHFGLQKVLFQVYPGQLTVITMHVE
jgi:murein DD-endopeptidase MepM/ murein hydrolase activator NlpD